MTHSDSREPSKSTFAFLEAAFNRGDIVVRETGVDAEAGPIRHAIDPAGRRILMIPISEDEFDAFVDDSAGTSVSLRRERYAEGNRIEPFLVFRCEPVFLRDTFAAFIDDVLDEFESGPSVSNGSSAAARVVLDRWRRLFATRGAGLLADKNIVGLAAELRVLVALLQEAGPTALESWSGPDGADHDFVLANCVVEVKGTQRKTGMEVEINGVGQLDVPEDRPLFLAAARVAFSPAGDVSIPALVDSALELGAESESFAEKLQAVGYHHSRADDYEKKKMDFLEDRFYRIVTDFPRIDHARLRDIPHSDRIRNISYLLDLTAHETVPGSLDVDGVRSFLKELL